LKGRPIPQPEGSKEHLADLGILLELCGECHVDPPNWAETSTTLIETDAWQQLSPAELAVLLYGIWRVAPQDYERWLNRWRLVLIPWLHYALDCVDVAVVEGTVSVRFVVDSDSKKSPNEQAVADRLEILRGIFPAHETFKSDGIHFLPFGLRPSIDDSVKNMPAPSLPTSVRQPIGSILV
jgi:hypothetical protein